MRAFTRKRQRSGNEVQVQVHDPARQEAQNYKSMLQDLMAMIQQYLLLTDDKKVRSTGLVEACGQHCSTTWELQDLHLA